MRRAKTGKDLAGATLDQYPDLIAVHCLYAGNPLYRAVQLALQPVTDIIDRGGNTGAIIVDDGHRWHLEIDLLEFVGELFGGIAHQ